MLETDALRTVLDYHERSKHHLHAYARSLGYMDWATQPDPFRRYEGARLLPLEEVTPAARPLYAALFDPTASAPRAVDRGSIAQLFYDSLALSAWKQHGSSRWPLRVNPSSGNLHPTEGYLLAPALPGLHERPAIYHYAPLEHGLELRRELSAAQWRKLTEPLPPRCVLVGLTSIHWRESWKYGERAFRYCHHDVGHAIAAVALAASLLGWRSRLIETLGDQELATLLDVHEQRGPEAEHADCLLVLWPHDEGDGDFDRTYRVDEKLLGELRQAQAWCGAPNRLSRQHHDWPVIEEVDCAAQRAGAAGVDLWEPPAQPGAGALDPPRVAARQMVRQRRSALAMDARTALPHKAFYRMMRAVLPAYSPAPFAALPWRPRVHLGLFVHRVAQLPPGLYLLLRDVETGAELRDAIGREFAWERPPDCPADMELYLLHRADARNAAKIVCCHQEIASDGAFALGMLAHFEPALRRFGPWFYKRLFWESGMIGQVLYLEAEAAGIRSTGIGCFFDDSVHQILGLADRRYQSLYHFTVGGHLDDPRLQSHEAYAHRRQP